MIKSNPQSSGNGKNGATKGHDPQFPESLGSKDGVLVIDKPEGLTSHDVVARVRKILGTRRVGHAGTLDPFATGVLVVCVNRATRLAQFLTGDDKEYVATMRLGFATDTGDLTGTPKTPVTDAAHVTSNKVQETFSRFLGPIKQIPPMYSAKKIGGVKLYEMARRGEEIERAPIAVEIKKLELLDPTDDSGQAQANAQTAPAEFSFRVVCSSGTYIRALAEEIGATLGVGAHLTRLRRTRSGSLSLDNAVTLEELSDLLRSGQGDQVMRSMADAIAMPTVQIGPENRKRVSHGRSIEHPAEELAEEIEGCRANYANGALAKLCDKKNQLIAIAEFDSDKTLWHPRVVLID
ncbi:MAG TPA: tRNA pseudouridine(55) synthase TruB [Blastocatellia bacterium]|nr:tRNA pseudouridine(55) synthase TruB [Blastocatellia bacterium]